MPGLPSMKSVLRSAMRSADIIHLEWTYTNGSGAVSYDAANSDDDTLKRKGVTTPVAALGTGTCTVRFPKCRRVRVLNAQLDPATPGTAERIARLATLSATAGTAVFYTAVDASNLQHPATSARAKVTIVCEYQ